MAKYLKKKKLVTKLFIISCLFIALIVSGNSASAAAEYSASLETDRSNGVCTYTVNGIDTNVIKEMTLKVTYTGDAVDNDNNNPDNNGNTDNNSPENNGNTDNNNPDNNGNTDNPGSIDNNTGNPGNNTGDADNKPWDNGNNTDNNTAGNAGSAASGNKGNSATDGNATVITALEQRITLDETNCTGGTYTGTFSLDSLEKYLFKEYDVSFIMGTAAEGEEPQVVNVILLYIQMHINLRLLVINMI